MAVRYSARRMVVLHCGIPELTEAALKEQWGQHPVFPEVGGLFRMSPSQKEGESGVLCGDVHFQRGGEWEEQTEVPISEFLDEAVRFEHRESLDWMRLEEGDAVVVILTGGGTGWNDAERLANSASCLKGARALHWLHFPDVAMESGSQTPMSAPDALAWAKAPESPVAAFHRKRVYEIRNEGRYDTLDLSGEEWAHAAMLVMEHAQSTNQGARDADVRLRSIAYASIEMPIRLAMESLTAKSMVALAEKELDSVNFHEVALNCTRVIRAGFPLFDTECKTVAQLPWESFLPQGKTHLVPEDYPLFFEAFVKATKEDEAFLGMEQRFESAVEALRDELGGLFEDDPKQGRILTLSKRLSRYRYLVGVVDDMTEGNSLTDGLSLGSVGWAWLDALRPSFPDFAEGEERIGEAARQEAQEEWNRIPRTKSWGAKEACRDIPKPEGTLEVFQKAGAKARKGIPRQALETRIAAIREACMPEVLPPDAEKEKVFTPRILKAMAYSMGLPLIALILWVQIFGWNPIQTGWRSWMYPAGILSVAVSVWVVIIARRLNRDTSTSRQFKQSQAVRTACYQAATDVFEAIRTYRASEAFVGPFFTLLNDMSVQHKAAELAAQMLESEGIQARDDDELGLAVPSSMISMVDTESLDRFFSQSLRSAVMNMSGLGPTPSEPEDVESWLTKCEESLKALMWNESRRMQELNVQKYLMDEEYRATHDLAFISNDFPSMEHAMDRVAQRMEVLLYDGMEMGRHEIMLRSPVIGHTGKEWDNQMKARLSGSVNIDIQDTQYPQRLGFLRISEVEPLSS